jgi:tRNA-modifying protein YgfZ
MIIAAMTAPTNTSPQPLDSVQAPFSGAVRLPDWGVLRAQGADAASFLQGQLTQDVPSLGEHEARLAGYCSAKGRLLGSFVMWRGGPEEILLACSADLVAPLQKRLSMFVLRAKCKITDASAELPLWGVAGAVPAGWPAAAWHCNRADGVLRIRLLDAAVPSTQPGVATVPRYLMLGQPAATDAGAGAEAMGTAPNAELASVVAAPTAAVLTALPALDHGTWLWLEAASGTVRITAATVEQFVPQMVNLDLVNGVNFQKGCYPGQEVVARSQYRGTLKRRAFLLRSETPLQPGQEIFHSADPGQPAGLVALAGSRGPQHQVLAEMKIAALEPGSGTLHAGSATGPLLTRAALPYALVEPS